MFHRRLMLLVALALVTSGVFAARLVTLTVVRGADNRQRAERVLTSIKPIPTRRGAILDRHLRVLAEDRGSYNIAVNYPVIAGVWAYDQAEKKARTDAGAKWRELELDQRIALIDANVAVFDAQAERLWQTLAEIGGIDHAELEERKNTIRRRLQQVASYVWLHRQRQRSDLLDEPVPLSEVAEPVGEQVDAHALLFDASPDVAARVRGRIESAGEGGGGGEGEGEGADLVWAQVEVQPARTRRYPLDSMTVMLDFDTLPSEVAAAHESARTSSEQAVTGVASHIVGQLRRVYADELDAKPYRTSDGRIDLAGYRPGDQIGAWGIERAQEDRLRGKRGQLHLQRDTGETTTVDPAAGRDVRLSLDVRLQARIEAAMQPEVGLMRVSPWQSRALSSPIGTPLSGAAVVLEVATSQVLAAVSGPSRDSAEGMSPEDRLIYQPYVFRPTQRFYPLGSTIKPLIMAAAMTDRKVGRYEKIVCNGYLGHGESWGDPGRLRCWIFKAPWHSSHGPLNGPDAIMQSCNVYFYETGRRMGSQGLTRWLGRFGLGRVTGCGLDRETPGILPSLDQPESRHEGIMMGIGQGPVEWTPLQAAAAYAALARGGYYISPTFLQGPTTGDYEQRAMDLELDPAAVRQAFEGMKKVVNDRLGTGHHLSLMNGESLWNIDGVEMYGKSGTATASPLRRPIDDDEDGLPDRWGEVLRRGDHAWFVAMVQRPGAERPAYVITVLVEFGGSGGNAAGPIVNQILHAMRAEGYL